MGCEIHAPLGPTPADDPGDPRDLRRDRLAAARLRRRLQLDHARDVADAPAQAPPDGPRRGGAWAAAGDLGDRRRCMDTPERVRRVPHVPRHRPRASARSPDSRSTCTGTCPAEWADIMPLIVHVHAKFYDIDEHRRRAGDRLPGARPRVRRAAATAASSPASGRATPSPTSARSTRSTWSASSTTSSAARITCRTPDPASDEGLLTCTSSPPTSNCSSRKPASGPRPGPRGRSRRLRRRRDVVLHRQGPRLAAQGARRHRRAADLAARRAADGLHLPGTDLAPFHDGLAVAVEHANRLACPGSCSPPGSASRA